MTYSGSDERFALLSHASRNLGDDIQSIAARQFLPKVDHHVQRDEVGAFAPEGSGRARIILNGWFMGKRSWPPSGSLEPLLISFHIGAHRYFEYGEAHTLEFLVDEASIEFFQAYGPVGCRDADTLRRLNDRGIDAYLSGCLTLTLRPPDQLNRNDEILIVDPAMHLPSLTRMMPAYVGDRVTYLTHDIEPDTPVEKRFQLAHELLRRYAAASLVITSRLHCALPCLAYNTPVLFVPPRVEPERLDGLNDFFTVLNVERGKVADPIPWEGPPANPDLHRKLVPKLRAACRSFIGGPANAKAAPHESFDNALGWQELEYFDESWRHRIDLMSRYIPAGASVLDLGCGKQWLRDYLDSSNTYIPVDYRQREGGCLVADFNLGQYPDCSADVTFVSGCLEYIDDPAWFVRQLCLSSSLSIISYCLIETHPDLLARRRVGWVTDLNHDYIVQLYRENGFHLTATDETVSLNSVFVFRRIP